MASNQDVKFEILESVGLISESPSGWRKEINLISWNGGSPKYDIRDWAPNHEKAGKGVTLSEDELKSLFNILLERIG